MYYLISNQVIPGLMAALDRREIQKKRQDREYVEEQRKAGWNVSFMMEIPDLRMLKSIVESGPRLSLNHWGLPMAPDGDGTHRMICKDNVRALIGNLERLNREELSDDVALLIAALDSSPQFDPPVNHMFVDSDGDEWEVTAWTQEEAQKAVEQCGRTRGPLEWCGSWGSWSFNSPIRRGCQVQEPVEDYCDMPEVEQAAEVGAAAGISPSEMPF